MKSKKGEPRREARGRDWDQKPGEGLNTSSIPSSRGFDTLGIRLVHAAQEHFDAPEFPEEPVPVMVGTMFLSGEDAVRTTLRYPRPRYRPGQITGIRLAKEII
jgi:hypothetical protein